MKCRRRVLTTVCLLAVGLGLISLCAPGATDNPFRSSEPIPPDDGKLRIIVFGAHPDDAEFRAGGVAAMWAAQGHHVKFVSVTNGDLGHYEMGGGPLARRRAAEVQAAADVLGIRTQVLDIHDGELMPTLENRKTMARLIREWQADIVMAHRPYDYNPDHRYVGVLAQDTAFMVTVPSYCPDTPPVEPNPVYLYLSDRFQKPYPFEPDIIVSIDGVFQQKIDAVHTLTSQVYETVYGVDAKTRAERLSRIPGHPKARRAYAEQVHAARYSGTADRFRDALIKWYGPEKGKAVKYAEAFEICEYGRVPTEEEIRKLFPFFPREMTFVPRRRMPTLGIRTMQSEDRYEVAELIYGSLNTWYRIHGRPEIFRGGPRVAEVFFDVYETLDPGCGIVAEDLRSGRLLASCFYHPRPHHVSLGIMNVHPNHFGRGAGRALLQFIIEFAKQVRKPLRLTQSAMNVESFSLYNKAGFVPRCAYQDMVLDVPADGLRRDVVDANRVRAARLDDVAAMAQLEMDVSGITREVDYRYCIENADGNWHASVFENEQGAIDGFLLATGHEALNMLGPCVTRTQEQAVALVHRGLNAYPGRTPLFLVPMECRHLVRTMYDWGARNCEMHFCQVLGEFQPFQGVSMPTFLPESG